MVKLSRKKPEKEKDAVEQLTAVLASNNGANCLGLGTFTTLTRPDLFVDATQKQTRKCLGLTAL